MISEKALKEVPSQTCHKVWIYGHSVYMPRALIGVHSPLPWALIGAHSHLLQVCIVLVGVNWSQLSPAMSCWALIGVHSVSGH